MSIEEQQRAADNATELQVEQEAEASVAQSDEATASENAETDEEKNKRVQEEAAQRRAAKEEKRQQSLNQRFAEITAEKYAEKARADALEKVIAQYGINKNQETQASAAPTRDQFDSYEDFLRAEARYEAKQEAEAATKRAIEDFQKSQERERTVSSNEEERKKTERQFLAKVAEVKKSHPDYQEVIEDWEPNLPPAVVNMIVRLADGPLISYHLAKNPALEARLSEETDPDMQKLLLGEIRSSLKAPAKTSAAPPPGKPVQAKAAANDGGYAGDPEGYYAWAQKNLR
jgi:hypothetical protein